jgi:uncharacterized protein (TIGR02265 family)
MELHRAKAIAEDRPAIQGDLADLSAWIKRTPETNTVKGMYVAGVMQAMADRGIRRSEMARIHAFRDYPLRDYMELLVDCAVTVYPQMPIRQGLRSLGQLAIPTFAKSIVGAVLMGVVGHSWELALKSVSRGYAVSLKPGSAVVAEIRSGYALVQLRNVWNFGDTYQVGVMEGLMEWCKLEGTVKPHVHSTADVDLQLEWRTH